MRLLGLCALLVACAGESEPASTVAFDLEGPLAGATFWDLPLPSDLRLTADGRPDLDGFPNPRNLPVVADLLEVARVRAGYPVMPIAYVRFTGAPPVHAIGDVIAAEASAPALLVDIDEQSPERGALYPLVAQTLAEDAFAMPGLVALAPRPGVVLRAGTRYAFVLRRGFAPEAAVPAAFARLARGEAPAGARAAGSVALYAPLWPALAELGVPVDDVLVATVFTTGDEVAVLRANSEAVRAAHDATIENVRVDTDGAAHAGYCELVATLTVPQFQRGAPPFDTDGELVFDGTGAPLAQGTLAVPLTITIPTGPMPTGGWPLWQFFHGSGGASVDLVDDGPSATSDGAPAIGEGPGAVVARRGIAAAAAALPLNPERLEGASNYAYLNLNNLVAFPSTFQQGVFEQRLLLDALLALEIPASVVASCPGAAATTHRFDAAKVTAGGHSMGGMYTNMIAAVEPRYGALTPFGAGGFWNAMILETDLISGSRALLAGVLGVEAEQLTFVHPALSLIGLGWEIAEPGAAMARLARRPLPGMTARHIYQPVGMDDQFFANEIFDAAALAYGNHQAGELVWPGTQEALRVDALDGMRSYPVRGNRGGTTNVVVQYTDGGILDGHYIHRQLPAVRYQYGCFLATYLRDGVPTVAAPAAADAACP